MGELMDEAVEGGLQGMGTRSPYRFGENLRDQRHRSFHGAPFEQPR